MPVTLTETAAREIATIIKQQELDAESIRMRVGVKGGGCCGFSYLLDLTETRKDTDEEWSYSFDVGANGEAPNGEGAVATGGDTFTIRVICDSKSYLYLNGTSIDFRDEMMGRGFVFTNPNATSTCGCGSSLSA